MARSLLALRSITCSQMRCLANGSTSGLVKTPIPLFGIDGRYVSALYSAAYKQKKLEVVDKELKNLLEMTQKDRKFQEFLYNPLVNAKDKRDVVNKALSSLKLSELTLNLIGVMSENGRIRMLSSVAKGFNRLMSVSRGELECTVTTAKPIDDNMKKEMEQSLSGFVKGQKLSLSLKVDPNILGGLIVDFGGEHYIDMSIRNKFTTYSNLIKQAV